MLTLTSTQSQRGEYESYKVLQRGIELLLKRARRVFGELKYVRTYEHHKKDATLHAHIIIHGLSPYVVRGCNVKCVPTELAVMTRPFRSGVWSLQTWLKNNAVECGMGYMADEIYIPTAKAINYVTKYLTKDLQGFEIKGIRRVQCSAGIGSPGNESEGGWKVGSYITARDFAPNAAIYDLNTQETINNAYWEQHTWYPQEDA